MPLRGTTRWQHARIEKRIINLDEGGDGRVTSSGTHYGICAWLDCDNDALELYKIRVPTHQEGYEERWMNYAFCSERCKQYWLDDWRRNRLSCTQDRPNRLLRAPVLIHYTPSQGV